MSVTDDMRTERSGGQQPAPAPRDGHFEKTPPQDVAAEQCVLGGMLLSKDAIADVVEILKSNDFYRPVHATIFDAILDIYGRGEPATRSPSRPRSPTPATWPGSVAPPTCTR
ncbi:hypothetical protein JNW87_20430 [Micromonospora sp. ATA51]|nr:hypothetical protein [Micromonospora sp. ATA51]